MIKNTFIIATLLFTSLAFSQKNDSINQKNDNSKSILFVGDSKNNEIDINKFNNNLKKELNSMSLFLYTLNDLAKNEDINLKFYNKPISKYAYENYRELELYSKSIPKNFRVHHP